MDISILKTQMLIIFIMISTGFCLRKAGILGKTIDSGLTKLVLYFTMPCMILNSEIGSETKQDPQMVFKFFIIAVVMYVMLPVIAFLIVRLLRIPTQIRGLYQFMLVFGNIGFMGFPVIGALYGPETILYAGIFNIIFNLVAYTYGIMVVAGDNVQGQQASFSFSINKLLTPGISISILAIVIYFIGVSFPDWVKSPVASFGNMTTPLAMMLIGSTLAGMDLKEVFADKRVYFFALLKEILLPVALFPLMKLAIRDQFLLQFTFILLIMPTANTSVLFAKEYDADENLAAKCVFITTMVSIVTIPLLMGMLF